MNHVNLSDAKDKLSHLVKETVETTEPVTISVHGKKEAVLISMEEYECLKATIEILQSKAVIQKIKNSLTEIEEGKFSSFKPSE